MSTKHTPGPWVLDGVEVYPVGGDPICAMSPGQGDELEANTQLIAAAPDLLEALKWSTFWLEGCLRCEAYVWDADQREAAEENLKASKAAIAKATGGES